MTPRPLDDIVFRSPTVTVAGFRCPASHPEFHDTGPTRNAIFVFPRRSVRLCHQGERPFLADPSVVTLYNQGQRYSRSPVSPAGDDCEWFAVAPGLLLEAVAHHDPSIRERAERPFRFAYGPCPPRAYLAQRTLFERLRAGTPLDPLQVEETVVSLLAAILDGVYAFWGRPPRVTAVTRRQQETAEQVQGLLAERLGEPWRLDDLAEAVGMSTFHLCRTFRAATGSTIHAYRDRMRLQRGLERLADAEDLTGVALDLGYSSHSHFTAAFRRRFGVTPSTARRRLRA